MSTRTGIGIRSATSLIAAAESEIGENPRVHPAYDLTKIGERRLGLAVRLAYEVEPRAVGDVELGATQQHRQRDHPLLHAVVEIALDALALGLECVDELQARAAELGDVRLELLLARAQQDVRQR